MTDAVYPYFKQICLSPGVDLVANTVKAILVSTTTGGANSNYVFSAADRFLSAVPSGAILGSAVAFSTKSALNGAFLAASIVFAAVPAGTGINAAQTGQAIIYYIDTGNAATSVLIGYKDTGTGLPVTPDGADITVAFSSYVGQLS